MRIALLDADGRRYVKAAEYCVKVYMPAGFLDFLGVGSPTPTVYSYLNHLLSAIIAFTDAGDFETPRVLIKGAVEVVSHPELVKLSKVERECLLSGISLVKSPNAIPNWTDLVDIVARMGRR